MTPAYMPFTYLSAATARILTALVGPMVVYQPSRSTIDDKLLGLASRGLIEIRTPVTRDEDRLQAALTEFTEWARMNPGRTTPGAGFLGARQAEIPFYDENAVNRIRSEIKHYHSSDPSLEESEAEFSARLFLAVAQANDLATDNLGRDLDRFQSLEKKFLEDMADADEAAFNRRSFELSNWREDPGAKGTAQRIRAWAGLAVADPGLPAVWVTTSAAVVDLLQETGSRTIDLERVAGIRLSVPTDGTHAIPADVLSGVMAKKTLNCEDLAPFTALAGGADGSPSVRVGLFSANRSPASVVRRMAPTGIATHGKQAHEKSSGQTLLVLVEG